MNETPSGADIPTIAESKSTEKPSHQVIALRRNIQAYAGTIASHLESRDQIIEESRQEITNLAHRLDQSNLTIRRLETEKSKVLGELTQIKSELSIKNREIRNLTTEIEGSGHLASYKEGYKKTILNLEKKNSELRRDLQISNALLDEAKRDKEKLFSLVSEAIEKR